MSISSMTDQEAQESRALQALSVGLFAGISAFLFHGLTDITVWGTRVSFLLWLFIGLVTAVHFAYEGKALMSL